MLIYDNEMENIMSQINIISIKVLFIGLLLSFAVQCCAATTVSIGDITADHGDTVTIPIMIDSIEDYGAGTINLAYDSAVVFVEDATGGSDSTVTAKNIDNTAGLVRISAWNLNGVSGNIVFADVTIKVVGNSDDSSTLTLTVDTLQDISYNEIPVDIISGSFMITGQASPTPTPPTPVEDTEPPVAVAEPSHQTVNISEDAYFNGSESTDNVGIVNYEWDFGGGMNATYEIVSRAYPTEGLYTVTLTVYDAANNSDTDTCSVSVLSPPTEQTNPYNVTDTPTDDGNNVTIDGTDIRGAEPLNDTVSIVLDNGTLVINIAVNVTDNTTGTVTSVTLDTPEVFVSSNRSADIDLNLNSSVWAGGCPVLTTQPFYDLNDTVAGWNGTAVGATATNAVTLAMSGLGLSVSDSGTAIMVHVNLSGINESDVLSLPINMTVDGAWYRDAADSKLTNVYLFKFYPNGTIKEQENPTGHRYDRVNDTYTFYFEMPGFSTFVLVGGRSSSSTPPGSKHGGDGTYPTPAPTPSPAIASAAGTPVKEGAAEEVPTPEQVLESRTEPPSLPPPISSPTAGIVIVAVAAIFGIVMVIRATEDLKKATIATIGIVVVAVAAIVGMMLM